MCCCGPRAWSSPAALADIQPLFGALTLIIVLFDGGSKLVVSQLIKSAPRASLLALLAFTFSTTVVAAVSMGAHAAGLLPDWSLAHGIMLGAILGGSSSLIIMPSMQLAKVEPRVANLVSLESALTDALCVVVTVAMIGVVVSGESSAGATMLSLAESFGVALAIGVAAGWTWMPVLRLLSGNAHAYPVTLAALIMLYVVVDGAGGSAAMAILAFAVIVGNADSLIKRVGFSIGDRPLQLEESVRTVHTQLTFIIKSFFFTFIGLMLAPPWSLLFLGVVVGSILLLARLPAVKLANIGAGMSPAQNKLVGISLPRGLAAGVLATMPAQAGAAGTENLPSLVFSAVVTSIVVFAVGFKLARGGQVPTGDSGPLAEDPPSVVTGVHASVAAAAAAASEALTHQPASDGGDPSSSVMSGVPKIVTAQASGAAVVDVITSGVGRPLTGMTVSPTAPPIGAAVAGREPAVAGASSGVPMAGSGSTPMRPPSMAASSGAKLGPSRGQDARSDPALGSDAGSDASSAPANQPSPVQEDEDVPMSVAIREIIGAMPSRHEGSEGRRGPQRRVLETNFNIPKQPPALIGDGAEPSPSEDLPSERKHLGKATDGEPNEE